MNEIDSLEREIYILENKIKKLKNTQINLISKKMNENICCKKHLIRNEFFFVFENDMYCNGNHCDKNCINMRYCGIQYID